MNSPLIILTQSYIDTAKLTQLVCRSFFESASTSSNGKSDMRGKLSQGFSDSEASFVFKNFESYQAQGRIIQLNFTSKKDSRETLSSLMQVYPEPTLMFLGNINDYSIALQEGLLKILEEPPHNLQIAMFAHDVGSLLPTIKSRSSLIPLPVKLVLSIIDQELSQKITKKLPKPADFTKVLLSSQFASEDVADIDVAKLERNEIDFWLWQIAANLSFLYEQKPTKSIARLIQKTVQAQELNKNNAQKKFILYSLLS